MGRICRDFSSLSISELPQSLSAENHIQILFLHNNSLSTLPESITKLCFLQEIYLTNNNFETFPTILCQMKSIREIHLGCNSISVLSNQITTISTLKFLSLPKNKISKVEEKFYMESLSALMLHDNDLDDEQVERIRIHPKYESFFFFFLQFIFFC